MTSINEKAPGIEPSACLRHESINTTWNSFVPQKHHSLVLGSAPIVDAMLSRAWMRFPRDARLRRRCELQIVIDHAVDAGAMRCEVVSKLAESDQNLIFDIGIETLNAEYTKANWKAFRAAYPALYMMMCRDATLEEACKATQIAERTHNADRKTFNSVLHLWIGLLRAGRTEDIDYCQREAYVYLSEQRFCRLKQGMVIPRELVKLSHWD